MKFCTKCGAPIVDDEAIFCGECGTKIEKDQLETSLSESETESKPQSVQEIMQQEKTQSEPVKSNSVLEAMNRAKAMRNTNQQNQPIQQPQSTQSTSTTNFSPASNSDGIVLELPTPIPSRIISNSSADNIGSIGATIGVIGFFLQFLQFTDSFYTIGRIGLGILLIGGTLVFINRFLYWTKGRTESKDVKIMRTHLPEIREMKFKFVSGVNAGAIYEKIAPSIKSQYGNKFEFDRQNETVSLIHEKVIYKIILNDDGTFCIWWMNLDNKPLDKISADDLYDVYANVLTCTAIIAYELQQQFGIN